MRVALLSRRVALIAWTALGLVVAGRPVPADGPTAERAGAVPEPAACSPCGATHGPRTAPGQDELFSLPGSPFEVAGPSYPRPCDLTGTRGSADDPSPGGTAQVTTGCGACGRPWVAHVAEARLLAPSGCLAVAAAPSRSAPALAVPRRFPDEPVLPPRVVRIDPRELAPEGDDEDPDRRPAFEHVPATASVAELPFGVDVPTYFTPPPSDEPTWIRFEVSQPDPLDPRNFPLRRRPLGR